MEIRELYQIFLTYPSICTDSRKVTDNSIFFALKGDQFDGNKFARETIKTCPYAVVDDATIPENKQIIKVDNVLETLQKLASFHRMQLNIPILAITGSNGKTTTKELIARVLAKKYKVWFTQGNLNNHIGVPLTLLQMTEETEFGIVEMGANHFDEISQLCEIAQPNFGIITNIGKAHLEGFGSIDGVKKAKGELYKYLYADDGLAFINSDNELLNELTPPHKNISYGKSKFTHCQGKIIKSDWFVELRWHIEVQMEDDEGNSIPMWTRPERYIKTHLFGSYNFENILAAVCVGNYFGIEDIDIKEAIESYVPQNNRSQVLQQGGNTIVMDAYNANPSSMKAALTNFSEVESANKTLILGDMLELGNESLLEHLSIVYLIDDLKFRDVYLVGSIFEKASNGFDFKLFPSVNELHEYLKEHKIDNAQILIKGSRGMKLERLLELL